MMKKIALVSRVEWGLEALNVMLYFRPDLDIKAVFTLPEEESNRHSNYISFDNICHNNSIPLIKTMNINHEASNIKAMGLDYLFVLGWSQLVKKEILESTLHGCIGNHPARLPRDRGRAPVTWQLIRGYHKSAMAFFFIDEGTDSGDIIMMRPITLTLEDTARDFYDKLIETGKNILKDMIPLLLKDRLPRQPQDHGFATYLPRRKPDDGIIDWNKSSFELYNWVRGLTRPFPGAFTFFSKKKLFVWSAKIESYMNTSEPPGLVKTIDEDGVLVTTGKGRIYLTSVQFERGEKIVDFSGGKLSELVGQFFTQTTNGGFE